MYKCELCSKKYETQKHLLKHIEKCSSSTRKYEYNDVSYGSMPPRRTVVDSKSYQQSPLIEDRSRSINNKAYLHTLPDVSVFSNPRQDSVLMSDIPSLFLKARETYDQKIQESVHQMDYLKGMINNLEMNLTNKTKEIEKDGEQYHGQILKLQHEKEKLLCDLSEAMKTVQSLQLKNTLQENEITILKESTTTKIAESRVSLEKYMKKIDESNNEYKEKLESDNSIKMKDLRDLYETRFLQLTNKYEVMIKNAEEKISAEQHINSTIRTQFETKAENDEKRHLAQLSHQETIKNDFIDQLNSKIAQLQKDLTDKDDMYTKKFTADLENSLNLVSAEHKKKIHDVEMNFTEKIRDIEKIGREKDSQISDLESKLKIHVRGEVEAQELERKIEGLNSIILGLKNDLNTQKQHLNNECSRNSELMKGQDGFHKQINVLKDTLESCKNTYENSARTFCFDFDVKIEKINKGFEEERKTYNDTISSLKSTIDELKSVVAEKQAELDRIAVYNKSILREKEFDVFKNDTLQQNYNDLQQQNKHLSENLTILSLSIDDKVKTAFSEGVKSVEDRVEKKNQEIISSQKEKEDLFAECQLKIENIQKEKKGLEARISELEDNHKQQKEDLVNTMQQKIDSKDTHIDSLKTVAYQVSSLQDKLTVYEEKIAMLSANIAEKDSRIASHREEIVKIKQEAIKKITDVSDKDKRATEILFEFEKLKYTHEQKDIIIAQHNTHIAKTKEDVIRKMKELTEKEADLEKVRYTYDSYKNDIAKKEKIIMEYDGMIRTLKSASLAEIVKLKQREKDLLEEMEVKEKTYREGASKYSTSLEETLKKSRNENLVIVNNLRNVNAELQSKVNSLQDLLIRAQTSCNDKDDNHTTIQKDLLNTLNVKEEELIKQNQKLLDLERQKDEEIKSKCERIAYLEKVLIESHLNKKVDQ